MKVESIFLDGNEQKMLNKLAETIEEGTFREEQLKNRAEARLMSRDLGGHSKAVEPVTQSLFFDETGSVRFGTVEYVLANAEFEESDQEALDAYSGVVAFVTAKQVYYEKTGKILVFGDREKLSYWLNRDAIFAYGGEKENPIYPEDYEGLDDIEKE